MARFDTLGMVVIVLFLVSALLFRAPAADRSAGGNTVSGASAQSVSFVQQDAVFSSHRGAGLTILTRKYKPRSTQPVSVLETLSLQECVTINYDPDCTVEPLCRRMIDRSRLIIPALVLGRNTSSVERTLFADRNLNQTFLTAYL
jgi:hypothetical protein